MTQFLYLLKLPTSAAGSSGSSLVSLPRSLGSLVLKMSQPQERRSELCRRDNQANFLVVVTGPCWPKSAVQQRRNCHRLSLLHGQLCELHAQVGKFLSKKVGWQLQFETWFCWHQIMICVNSYFLVVSSQQNLVAYYNYQSSFVESRNFMHILNAVPREFFFYPLWRNFTTNHQKPEEDPHNDHSRHCSTTTLWYYERASPLATLSPLA